MLTPGDPFSVSDLLRHLALPALLLSIGHTALIMRYMRASLLEVLHQDYVRTARAKGVREWWVIVKHALRNALLPVVTRSEEHTSELQSLMRISYSVFCLK